MGLEACKCNLSVMIPANIATSANIGLLYVSRTITYYLGIIF